MRVCVCACACASGSREARPAHPRAIDRSISIDRRARARCARDRYTSEEVTAPLLAPEMVGRVAAMLNYFLSLLAGPERRRLAVKNPEQVCVCVCVCVCV